MNIDARADGRGWFRGKLCLDHRVGQRSGIRTASRAGNGHGHVLVHGLDLELESGAAVALDFDFHGQGLGLRSTTPGLLVRLKAANGPLAWVLPSQNITLPPYLL